jgi:hypothetical protein
MVDFCLSNGPFPNMLSSSSDTELSSNGKQAFALTPCLTPILDKERVRGKHSTPASLVGHQKRSAPNFDHALDVSEVEILHRVHL